MCCAIFKAQYLTVVNRSNGRQLQIYNGRMPFTFLGPLLMFFFFFFWVCVCALNSTPFNVMTQSSITNYIYRHLNTIYIHMLGHM